MPSNNKFQDKLDAFYKARKHANRLPENRKRMIINHARHQQPRASIWQQMTQWSYAAAALLCLAIVVWFSQAPIPQLYVIEESLNQEDGNWYIHDLVSIDPNNAEQTVIAAAQRRHRYQQRLEQGYDQYLLSKANLETVNSQSGVLIQLEDNWQIALCEQAMVQLSAQLVSALKQQDDKLFALIEGDTVEIITDQQGHIIAIHAVTEPLHCG